MKLYIAGPMTGYPSFNIPKFDKAAAILRSEGFDVVSPAELDDPEIRAISLASPDGAIATIESHGKTWGDFLARDVKLIADGGIQMIAVLPGWYDSSGARLETFVGKAMKGLPIMAYQETLTGRYAGLSEVSSGALVRAWAGHDMWADVIRVLQEPSNKPAQASGRVGY